MKILSLWSGPRNVSTALMYAFAQRPDAEVVDEPLYAHYLSRTMAGHPGEKEVLHAMENDGKVVMQQLTNHSTQKSILFLKNMAHHWVDLDLSWLNEMDHLFLIRDPVEMLPSLVQQLPHPIIRDTGLKTQVELYTTLEKMGRHPAVVNSKDLLLNPRNMLKMICNHLQITFYDGMLTWDKGPRKEDGVWAKYWYHNVHNSTAFGKYQPKQTPFPETLRPLLEECTPYYNFLNERALKN